MCERFRSRAAIGLLVICVSWVACAQTAAPPTPTNESGKKCLPPKVTYSPEPSPSYYPPERFGTDRSLRSNRRKGASARLEGHKVVR